MVRRARNRRPAAAPGVQAMPRRQARRGARRKKDSEVDGKKKGKEKVVLKFPVDSDFQTFAKELGMDLEFDAKHFWLIEQALASALPPVWTRIFDPSTRSYYVRRATKSDPDELVTWTHPLVPAYKKIFDNILEEQAKAERAALGIVSEDEEEDTLDSEVPSRDLGDPAEKNKGFRLTSSQRKKLQASIEDAMLFYKKSLGDPGVEDVGPKESIKGYWDVDPEDVKEMAEYMELDLHKDTPLLWVARMAVCAPLPPGWSTHGNGDEVSTFYSELHDLSVEELGSVYVCQSWMCKSSKVAARMALRNHPSEAYFDHLIKELRADFEGFDDDDSAFDDFGGGVVPVEFRDSQGYVYTYDFSSDKRTKTSRYVPLDEEEDDEQSMMAAEVGQAPSAHETRKDEKHETKVHDGPRDARGAEKAASSDGAQARATATADATRGPPGNGRPDGVGGGDGGGRGGREEEEDGSQGEGSHVKTPADRLLEKLVRGGFPKQQVVDLARHIGIDLVKDSSSEFLWLIDQCLMRPIHNRGWFYRERNPDGQPHYYRKQGEVERNGSVTGPATAASQWEHPAAGTYKKLLVKLRRDRDNEIREARVAELRRKSSLKHVGGLRHARNSGRQAILGRGDESGASGVELQRPALCDLQEPKVFKLSHKPNAAVARVRPIPLQPGFSTAEAAQNARGAPRSPPTPSRALKHSHIPSDVVVTNEAEKWGWWNPDEASQEEYRPDSPLCPTDAMRKAVSTPAEEWAHRVFRHVQLSAPSRSCRAENTARKAQRPGRRKRKNLKPRGAHARSTLRLDALEGVGVISLRHGMQRADGLVKGRDAFHASSEIAGRKVAGVSHRQAQGSSKTMASPSGSGGMFAAYGNMIPVSQSLLDEAKMQEEMFSPAPDTRERNFMQMYDEDNAEDNAIISKWLPPNRFDDDPHVSGGKMGVAEDATSTDAPFTITVSFGHTETQQVDLGSSHTSLKPPLSHLTTHPPAPLLGGGKKNKLVPLHIRSVPLLSTVDVHPVELAPETRITASPHKRIPSLGMNLG